MVFSNVVVGRWTNMVFRCADTLLEVGHYWQVVPEFELPHSKNARLITNSGATHHD